MHTSNFFQHSIWYMSGNGILVIEIRKMWMFTSPILECVYIIMHYEVKKLIVSVRRKIHSRILPLYGGYFLCTEEVSFNNQTILLLCILWVICRSLRVNVTCVTYSLSCMNEAQRPVQYSLSVRNTSLQSRPSVIFVSHAQSFWNWAQMHGSNTTEICAKFLMDCVIEI